MRLGDVGARRRRRQSDRCPAGVRLPTINVESTNTIDVFNAKINVALTTTTVECNARTGVESRSTTGACSVLASSYGASRSSLAKRAR